MLACAKTWERFEKLQTSAGGIRVAGAGFGDDELGGEQNESRPCTTPPFTGDILVGRDHDITRKSGP